MGIERPAARAARVADSGEVQAQYGALCFRERAGEVQVLVISSRGTGRWIVPKGWPQDGSRPDETAAREAWEEAGARGRVASQSLGNYQYAKWVEGRPPVPCLVEIFPLRVEQLTDVYPEAGQRKRKWVSRDRAAKMLTEPELQDLVRAFDPAKFPL